MSIAAVDRTLLRLLRAGLGLPETDPSIASISPSDAQGKDIRVGLFLYSAIEDAVSRSRTMRPASRSPIDPATPQPITLELDFLLTAYGTEASADPTGKELSAHDQLSRCMAILHDNAVLTADRLDPVLHQRGIETLNIAMNSIHAEDMTRIWSMFPGCSYRPSVSYVVRPFSLATQGA